MKKVTYRLKFNRKNKLNSKGQAVIQIEAYLNEKRKYFSTGIKIKPNQWNENKQVVNSKHPKHLELNRTLKKQIYELEKFEDEQRNRQGSFILADFKLLLKNEVDFFEFSTRNINEVNSTENYRYTLRRTLEFIKEIHPNITFNRIDFNTVKTFDNYLHKENYHVNTIAKYHKNFKRILNFAIKQKLIKEDPYSDFKVKRIASKRTALTDDELKRIENLEFDNNSQHLKNVRDLFLFSCYTGLRFSDMQALSPENFVIKDSEMFLDFRQNKTAGLVMIPLHLVFNGKAIPIVNEYINPLNKHLFPRMTNQENNRVLKLIQMLAGINKVLTYHMSRHTFGTLLAKYTNDPYLIKALMGHKDIKTSMIYIHLSNNVVNEKLKNVKW